MIRVQYFANVAGDVAVIMSDIEEKNTFFGLWDLMDFKQPSIFKVSLLLFLGNLPLRPDNSIDISTKGTGN